jgi:hypothetical protein
MIKLIKEFLQSGIEANKSIIEAMNASVKSHNKSLEWYDVTITKEINNINFQIQNNKSGLVPFSEMCSCNPKNGGSGICNCSIGDRLV